MILMGKSIRQIWVKYEYSCCQLSGKSITKVTQTSLSNGRYYFTLQKLAYVTNRDCLSLKTENFQQKKIDIFLIFAQNIDCGYTLEPPRRGGFNEYQQSMFWSKNKKNRYTPAYPSFVI